MSILLEELAQVADLQSLARRRKNNENGLKLEDLRQLLDLARRLNASRDREEALGALLSSAISLTAADRGVLVEGDETGFHLQMGIDRDGVVLDHPDERISHSIITRVLASGKALKSENLSEELDLSRARSVIDLELKSSLCVPLFRQGRVVGAIYVDSNSTTRFNETMLILLEGTCELASMTLNELQLHRAEEGRRQAFEELEATHAHILDALPNVLILFNDLGQIQLGNQQFDLHVETLPCLDFCPEAPSRRTLNPQLLAIIRESMASGTGCVDYIHERGAIRVWPFQLPARSQGPPLNGCIIADVTLEKQLQRELLDKEKMSTATRMAGSIAHEIRNALAPLSGHAELLRYRLDEIREVTGCYEEDLDRIQEMSGRIKRIAENLGRLARPLAHHPQPTDINQLLRHVVDLLRETGGKIKHFTLLEDGSLAPDTGLSLGFHLQDGLPHPVADPDLLMQLLMNLIINAAHAVEDQGGGQIQLRSLHHGNFLRLEVADTGCGMSPEVLARIWDPYFTTKGERGTGLGMTLVRMVAESHKALLHIESAPGVGTTFRLDLPLT